jgi:predicted nucleic acid-binding protein
VAYVDTSGLAKLLHAEAESAGLKDFLREYQRVVSSALARTELLRVAHRLQSAGRLDATGRLGAANAHGSANAHIAAAEQILDRISTVPVTANVLDRAGRLLPGSTLRSLDAIHLASALALPSLDAFVTYDACQADAAAILGLPVTAPTNGHGV